ncbi:pre-mRNA-processing ATP-dependent RNA helicase PRP5 [Pochonia chlamydosporia 170]|uniref:RNA helicase n=1 Tax=Pochonia chlamydosporia 170 TaxID=1380566 RepID=A0A179G466_METCM|nr:pre-mRNA-processing ATP-dependent RNA helicase PRP5 [Pochonia chlamydosporia 170]OAQ72645.1 pre-mRNA-processing ATP-dependent RNA helicase PRP5 [Pochonia chlamydosporia 170]
MARPRDSRSPSPAGSQISSRRHRKDDDRRDRDRRDDGRDYRRRSRSRSPDVRRRDDHGSTGLYSDLILNKQNRYRDRGGRDRDRDRDRDSYRRRERSVDRRDDDHYRGGTRDHRDRERRRSRDRYNDRPRSPARRRNRSRDDDRDHRRRPDSRDGGRGRREGTADSHPRSSRADSRNRKTPLTDSGKAGSDQTKKTKAAAPPSDADKKAERLAKLEAWKKKKESESQKQKEVNPSQTRSLLAEMDMKALGHSPSAGSPGVSSVASPATLNDSGSASPAVPYAGKFDPKTIAKKSAASRTHDTSKSVLGSLDVQQEKMAAPVKQKTIGECRQHSTVANGLNPVVNIDCLKASALPANRVKTSAFGFGKSQADADKLPTKRKLDLDEEDTTKRTLTKLPALPMETDDTPYADQDEDDDSDGDNFAENEEEAAAAARAAHERRLQTENQTEPQPGEPMEEDSKEDRMQVDQETNGVPESNGVDVAPAAEPKPEPQPEPAPEAAPEQSMDVDEEEDVDPLDAFMADLKQTETKKPVKSTLAAKKAQEPEAYFSDDEYNFDAERKGDGDILAIANKRKKKDIPTVDYSKIDLVPVRKNFWVEPAELSALTEEELADLRLELDGIKVNGKDVPKPVQKWAQCGLTRQTLDVIDNLGYEKPTTIQMQAIPTLMSGRDVVGVAKTGSGKTVAFLLPMFRHIMDQPPIKDTDGPVGLIMTPTRELATQIHRDCKPFLKSMGLRAVCAYGGAPIRDQIAELKRGAEIIVCTPGRMIDLLAANQGRVTNLRRVTYVVLDEADRMFDMGFEPQVMKIFASMRPDKQTILFSATMPRIIDSLTKKVLKSPVEITVGGRSVVAKEIEQIVEVREESTKFFRVLELLGELYDRDEDARALIFVDRQEKADDLLKELMIKGYPCMSIHGGKDQVDRDSTISDFKKGVVPLLVATSVAARGLDVKQLKLVINYDAPNHLEDYVHRAGRTGRAGNTGVAVTFVTPDQENCAPGIAKALEQSEQPVPERLNEMRKAHREKVKSGKAKDSSGFGGKGLDRLDQEREAARLRERRTHKAEGEEEEEKEDKEEENKKAEKALDAIRAAASGVQARDNAKAAAEGQKGSDTPTGGADKTKDALDKVSSAVSAINSRLGKAGQLRSGQPIDNKGPDAGAYHATLEINDFPQKARWAVTNRTNVAKILDSTGTSITTKGSFYPAGKEVPPNADPKLYILIEGDTELAVGSALQEMTRLLREGTIAAADADSRAPASGRYTVS